MDSADPCAHEWETEAIQLLADETSAHAYNVHAQTRIVIMLCVRACVCVHVVYPRVASRDFK